MIKIKKMDIGVKMDIGAPTPTVLSDERSVYLLFYKEKKHNNWTGESVKIRNPKLDKGVVLIKFNDCSIYKFGFPDEGNIEGHPYYKHGLGGFNFYEVINSEWIKELNKIQEFGRYALKNSFKNQKHYFFAFHDSSFECISQQFNIKEFKNESMEEVIKQVSTQLNK